MDLGESAGGAHHHPPPSREDLQLSNKTGILQKKKKTSPVSYILSGCTPPPPPHLRKILEPPPAKLIPMRYIHNFVGNKHPSTAVFHFTHYPTVSHNHCAILCEISLDSLPIFFFTLSQEKEACFNKRHLSQAHGNTKTKFLCR